MARAIGQTIGIIAVACILAVCTNLLRQNSLPFAGDWSADSRLSDDTGQSMVVGLTEASRMYAEDTAVFVDARPEHQYAQGHIKDAVSLPWQQVHERFMEAVDRLETAETLICYCDGENCELSHDLALFLANMGFEDTRVLVNGWTVWKEAGLPAQSRNTNNE
jgi:rhodanese-related sulfurtransferase